MKKLLAVILSAGMLFALASCGNDKNNEQELPENEIRNEAEIDSENEAEIESETENEAEGESEAENVPIVITKEVYEQMTAEDLFNAVVKSPDTVTLEEYVAIIETLQFVDITDSMDLKKSITNDLLKQIGSEYDSKHRPNPRDWVPLLINHEAPQVRGEAFGNAYYLYGENPEFLAAAKEVMKAETDPFVIYNIIRQLPSSIVAKDTELIEFVQGMTTHENTWVQKVATKALERAAEENQ